MRKKTPLLLAAALLGLAVLLLGKAYLMESDAGNTLLWNRNEAFVMVSRYDLGWRGNYVRVIGWLLRSLLGGHASPTDRNSCIVMFRITPTEVHRISLPDDFSLQGVCKSEMYAGMQGSFWRWSGREFVRLQDDQRKQLERALGTPDCPIGHSTDYVNEHDWSSAAQTWRRECEGRCDFPLALGDSTVVVTLFRGDNGERLELRRDSTVETLSSVDYRSRKVDRSTYESVFDRHCTVP